MQIGDKVIRYPKTFLNTERDTPDNGFRPMSGVVVYIHPKKRFHVVEFEMQGQKFRESFQGI